MLPDIMIRRTASLLAVLLAAMFVLCATPLAQAAVCNVDVGSLDFGTVDAVGNAAAATSTDVSIQCDGITPQTETITLCGNFGAGTGGASGGLRHSTAPGGVLDFVLYTTGGHTTPWGSVDAPSLGDPFRIELEVTGTSASRTLQLHGLVPAGQATAVAGQYQSSFTTADAVFVYAEGDLDCAAPSGGANATAPFAMSATVIANCLLETDSLDFGTAGLIGDNIDATTDLALTCTSGTGYSISIGGGGAGDPEQRLLQSGDHSVRYDLYSNAPRTQPWGTAPGSIVTGDGDGTEHIYTVYGRIPPQPAAAGSYTDTVVVTITY